MFMRVRFAPSPTGSLHIGGARTALFNWLYARHNNGKFLLRIEDTDRERSTKEAVDIIFQNLKWLELDFDEEPILQSSKIKRHIEVAKKLLNEGKAYYCYCTQKELENMRNEAKDKGQVFRYDGKWRDKGSKNAPTDVKPVIRFKAPISGQTEFYDQVQNRVCVDNTQLDDMVLLRSDETPTYMLSVVVDDHDMNITDIIRGVDHLTNTFRQINLYKALDWEIPCFAHIPLIHGQDGAKLSKRHGALGVESYRAMGFLPEAIRNSLLRLGWSHGDDEIINTEQAVKWFTLKNIGKSPARFNIEKLTSLNAHYMRSMDNEDLFERLIPFLKSLYKSPLSELEQTRILKGLASLKDRSKTFVELAESSLLYLTAQKPNQKAQKFCNKEYQSKLRGLLSIFENLTEFSRGTLEGKIRDYASDNGEKLGTIAQPLRVALTGSTISPSLFEIIEIFGKDETIKRLNIFINEDFGN
ncbi:MAG: glutamate--tRNA ligase [Alphaproteobacteria bacterium]